MGPGRTGQGFHEVADRVWVARYPWFDVNVTVVAGTTGAVVVDTHGSAAAAREVVDDVGRIPGGRPVVAVVNTHEHFDHTFGNATMQAAWGPLPIHAHERAAARTREAGERVQAAYADHPKDPHAEDVLATELLPADQTFTTRASIDLGDRVLELRHHGRGHTGGDLVAAVPDADVLLAGDLVEESGPPAFGDDAFPLEWPTTLAAILADLGPDAPVVPGHGEVVDRAFVVSQQADLVRVADTIRRLVEDGVPRDEALHAVTWPWPHDVLDRAVRRGYDHLDDPLADPAPGP